MQNGIFGSKVDWISQHSVLPDYFRQLFYDTGNLFPEYAANIGGGQNIYNFSYYGLYNPVILFSYLFPSVKMGNYIMAAMIVSLIATILLFYRWLRGRGISKCVSILTSVLLLVSGPMIYHSYNQIMFVNYMPFLCLALIGVDRHFDRKKDGVYTVGVWLMIMTSFYFSIGGMLVLVLYGIYRYLEQEGKKNVRTFLLEGIRFLYPMLVAVLMSAILLVPTAYVLMSGRASGTKHEMSLGKLLMPDINVRKLLYSPYGTGVAVLVVVALIAGLFYKKCSEKWLHIACIIVFCIPFFAWVLNGGLYIRDKVFIPFLPLLCYMTAGYVEKLRKREISFAAGLMPILITFLLLCSTRKKLCWEDGILTLAFFLICYWKKCMQYLVLPAILILCVHGYTYNENARDWVEPEYYRQITDETNREVIEKVAKDETGFYRIEQNGSVQEDFANLNRIWSAKQYISSIYSSVENPYYQNFRTQTFMTEQPYRNVLMQSRAHNSVMQRFMGVKYLVSDAEVAGYKKIGAHLYENENVLPVAYYTENVISQAQYDKLQFPYNQLAFLSYAVVAETDGKSIDLKPDIENPKEIPVKFQNDQIAIPGAGEGNILFLQFDVDNKSAKSDVGVSVDGVRNKLTARNHIYYNGNTRFTYAAALKKGQTSVSVTQSEGNYDISNVRGYLWKGDPDAERRELVAAELVLDKEATKGDVIKGSISATGENGYLITSIPYDENFEVLVDGKTAEYEMVNTAFLGLKLSKGQHTVELRYHAPGVLIGKILSVLGLVMFVGMLLGSALAGPFLLYRKILSL